MKKSLLALAVGMLLSTSVADAAKVYFLNDATPAWNKVYAYTWAPDDGFPLEALDYVTIGGEKYYYKDTDKENIKFLNGSSWAEATAQTAKLAATDGAVYNAASSKIGTISGEGENLTFTAQDPEVMNSGYFLAGTMNDWDTQASYQFSQTGEGATAVYKLTTTLLPGTKFKIVNADFSKQYTFTTSSISADNEYALTLDPTEGNDMVAGDDLYGVTLTVSEDFSKLTVSAPTGEAPVINWYGAWSANGSWTSAGDAFVKDGANYTAVFASTAATDAKVNFGLFQTIKEGQVWSQGTRYVPQGQANVEVSLGTAMGYNMQVGATGTWVLTTPYEVGNWTVTIAGNNVNFAWANEAIVISTKGIELTDGAWSGTLAADATVEFNKDGVMYGLAQEPTVTNNGNDLVYTLKLAANSGQAFDAFDVETEAEVSVDFDKLEATITLKNANKPVMMVGDKAVDLTLSGAYYNAYAVSIAADDAISFVVDGKTYVPTMPETIAFEAKEVTMALTPGTEGVSFANVQTKWSNGKETPFITNKFNPNVLVNSTLTSVTFSWDSATGVDAIEADNNGEAVYFNLQGVRVANPENGIFIEVKGGKAVKVRK